MYRPIHAASPAGPIKWTLRDLNKMTSGISKITRELKTRRTLLLERYDNEDLHQLRINIRRLRGTLKGNSRPRARKLRREWGIIAQCTNAARDWDTLATYADKSLSPTVRLQLHPLIAQYCTSAHDKVLAMLKSKEWDHALKHWQKLADRNGDSLFLAGPDIPEAIKNATRARRASLRALTREDEGSWHKFRIAIKDLRYTLDNQDLTQKKAREQAKPTIKLCRRLQESLGDWHDHVVHRTLLARLADNPPASEDDDLAAALKSLQTTNHNRGSHSLKKVKKLLQAKGHLLEVTAGNP